MVMFALIYAENLELEQNQISLGRRESRVFVFINTRKRLKPCCLQKHSLSILPLSGPFSAVPLCCSAPSRGADPPRPLSQCPALPVQGFSLSQHQAPITQPHILTFFIVLSVLESKPMPQPQTTPGCALPPTLHYQNKASVTVKL